MSNTSPSRCKSFYLPLDVIGRLNAYCELDGVTAGSVLSDVLDAVLPTMDLIQEIRLERGHPPKGPQPPRPKAARVGKRVKIRILLPE